MNEFDLIIRFKSDEDSITLRSYIADNLLEDKLFDNLEMWDFKRSEVLSIVNLQKENAELKKELEKEQNLNKVIKERLVEVNCDCNAEKKEKCVMYPEYCEGERKTVVDLMSLVSDGLNESLIKQKEEQIEQLSQRIIEQQKTIGSLTDTVDEMKAHCKAVDEVNHKMMCCSNCKHEAVHGVCVSPEKCTNLDKWELPDD